MFYSHSLLSNKGPLSSIWLAAYFFKKLKKAQVTQTDISSSVDKILQDEFDVVTYRVLAYLLLGVVRIFSKKVEYLFIDCNKVVLEIKDFVVSNKEKALVEKTLQAPYFSITVPERFELDTFDLEILEDTIEGNVLPLEDITLKDSRLNSGAMIPYALDKNRCEEPAHTCHDFRSAAHNLCEDAFPSQRNDIDMEAGTSHNLSNSEVSIERLRGNWSSLREPDLQMFSSGEAEHLNGVKSYTEKHYSEEEHTRVLQVEVVDEMHGESSMRELWGNNICDEALLNFEILGEVEEETANPSKLLHEHCQTHRGDPEVADEARSENESHQIMEDSNLINVEVSVGKLQDNIVSHEECGDMDMSNMVGQPPEHIKPFDGKHPSNTESIKLLETEEPAESSRSIGEEHQTAAAQRTSLDLTLGDGICLLFTGDLPLSLTLNMTPKSKTVDASGVSAPEFLSVPTPAAKERPRVPRKRKFLFDDVIIFPNNVIKRFIEDTSDLVSKRRKAPHTALGAWRTCQLSSLPQCFWEPAIPYTSLELRSLFRQKKLKIPASLGTAELGQKFVSVRDVETCQNSSKDCNDMRSVETANSLENLNASATPAVGRFVGTVESPGQVDMSEPPAAGRSVEQTVIAPGTPVHRTKSLRSFESPERPEISDLDRVRLESERLEKEPSPSKEQNLDLNFMNEDINSCEGDKQDQYGLSERTRVVERYLNRSFLNQKEKSEDEVVNLMSLLQGRTKKESARLFYEILVLKGKGYVHVKQENAFGDILIWKTSQWERACDGSPVESTRTSLKLGS